MLWKLLATNFLVWLAFGAVWSFGIVKGVNWPKAVNAINAWWLVFLVAQAFFTLLHWVWV